MTWQHSQTDLRSIQCCIKYISEYVLDKTNITADGAFVHARNLSDVSNDGNFPSACLMHGICSDLRLVV
jgi:hypothetical protein